MVTRKVRSLVVTGASVVVLGSTSCERIFQRLTASSTVRRLWGSVYEEAHRDNVCIVLCNFLKKLWSPDLSSYLQDQFFTLPFRTVPYFDGGFC